MINFEYFSPRNLIPILLIGFLAIVLANKFARFAVDVKPANTTGGNI